MVTTDTDMELGVAQIPTMCQFCEEGNIKWKCINCDSFLCQYCCNKIHKLKSTRDHKIINLNDIGTYETADIYRKIDLELLTCAAHEGQRMVAYCCNCSNIICFKCQTDGHTEHKIVDLYDFYSSKLDKIKNVKEVTEAEIQKVNTKEGLLNYKLQEVRKNIEETNNKILKQEEEIINEVRNHTKELMERVNHVYNPITTHFHDKITQLKEKKNVLHEKSDILKKSLKSREANQILNMCDPMDEEASEEFNESGTVNKIMKFIPNTRTSFVDKFGEICPVSDLHVIQRYEGDLRYVRTILHVDNKTKFIGNRSEHGLKKLLFENETITVQSEEKIEVYDMAMFTNGNLIISSKKSCLNTYNKEGSLNPFQEFPNYDTLGVYVNNNDDVYVGLIDPNDNMYTNKDNSIKNTKVLVLNSLGELKHSYRSNDQLSITWPRRIITCGNYICIVDLLNESFEGRVIAFNYEGKLEWTYYGQTSVDSEHKYFPSDLVVTSKNEILICDGESNSLDVLNKNGDLIVCHDMTKIGIEKPLTLHVDPYSTELLWIGSAPSNSKNGVICETKQTVFSI